MAQRDPAAWPADFGQGRFNQHPGLHLVDSSYPEAAHAASEFDSDPPREPMTQRDMRHLLLMLVVSAACVAGFVVVAWSRWLP